MFYYMTLGNHSEEKELIAAPLVVGELLDCICETLNKILSEESLT